MVSECLPFNIEETAFMKAVGNYDVKPSSLASLIMLDFGLFGFIFPIILSVLTFSILLRQKRASTISKAFLLASAIAIILGGFPLTLPHFWIVWFLFVRSHECPAYRRVVVASD